jgi:hypothetical protein
VLRRKYTTALLNAKQREAIHTTPKEIEMANLIDFQKSSPAGKNSPQRLFALPRRQHQMASTKFRGVHSVGNVSVDELNRQHRMQHCEIWRLA